MAASDVPDEAVEAVIRDRARRWGYTDNLDEEGMALWLKHCGDLSADLAAAAPHLRAQILAEVDAALRDGDGYVTWERARIPKSSVDYHVMSSDRRLCADYLRDTLGGDHA